MRRPRPRVAIVSVLLLGVLIFAGAYYAWNTATAIFQPVTTDSGRLVPFEVTAGETTAQIADGLVAKGLIRNALAFRVWARVKGLDTHLEAGIYKLNTSVTISDLVDQLLNGQPDAMRITIQEGWRIEQIGQRFASAGLTKFSMSDFLTYTKHIDKFPDRAKYPILNSVPPGDSMEGLLFPASYEVAVGATAQDVVNLMLTALNNTIQQDQLDKIAAQHHLDVYHMIILASLVEREVRFPEDRGGVASVYWNRIFIAGNETAGFLGSDPSVEYARDMQTTPQAYWTPLTDLGRNIAPDSLWNTYVHKGWPPTPICSSGLASLAAAASPSKTDYLYFLGTKEGHIIFAKTSVEFQQDVQKYLP